MSGGPSSRKSGLLTKNSVIKCTIDDLQLQEGLLVVSFAHKDNLYQGVLLQLSRERGIPCGISFPKEYFSGEKKEPEQNANPLQIPPINQRHTYFQDVDARQFRSLRRIIKTPARFKNSRMSLRPVQRPVLCAKCGVLCEDKDKSQPPASAPTATATAVNGHHDKSKKTSANGKPATAATSKLKKITTKSSSRSTLQSNPEPKPDLSISPVLDDPSDFNYEGVGSHGIVDNAWKRPLAKSLKYPTRQNVSLLKHTERKAKPNKNPAAIPTPSTNKRKLKIVGDNTDTFKDNPSISDSGNSQSQSVSSTSSSYCPVFRITRPPALKSTDKQKANNLKLCITKLVLAQESNSQLANNDNDNLISKKDEESSWKPQYESEASNHSNLENSPVHNIPSMKMKIPIRKSKIKLRKRSSAMPYRMRDRKHSSASARMWRTRKISTMSNPEETTTTTISKDKLELEEEETESGAILKGRFDSSYKGHELAQSFEAHTNTSNTSTSPLKTDESIHQAAKEKCDPHPGKTPVIKITFGSSGNGMVVQIPPRITTTGESEQQEASESKAARKAMKKAKKEARKKHSSPGLETSPTLSPPSPDIDKALVPLTIHCNLGHTSAVEMRNSSSGLEAISRSYSTPADVDPNESSEDNQSISIHNHVSNTNPNPDRPSASEPESTVTVAEELELISPRSGKKRKKDKKKRKSKDHKENNLDVIEPSAYEDLPEPDSSVPELRTSSPIMLKIDRQDRPVLTASRRESGDSTLGKVDDDPSVPKATPQRVCISLRRLTSNAYVPLNSSLNDELEVTASHVEPDEQGTENEEPLEFSDSAFVTESHEEIQLPILSVEAYNHVQSNHCYRKGDVVWAKSTGCPWWPGKISDILLRGVDDVRAKIAWYKSARQSFIAFTDLHPFQEYYEIKYTKNRKRGFYQQAVREASTDAQQLNSQDLSND